MNNSLYLNLFLKNSNWIILLTQAHENNQLLEFMNSSNIFTDLQAMKIIDWIIYNFTCHPQSCIVKTMNINDNGNDDIKYEIELK